MTSCKNPGCNVVFNENGKEYCPLCHRSGRWVCANCGGEKDDSDAKLTHPSHDTPCCAECYDTMTWTCDGCGARKPIGDGALHRIDTYGRRFCAECAEKERKLDNINNPPHYTHSEIEPINVIFAWGWGEAFCLGNAVKYLSRAGHKGDKLEDLKKAQRYLNTLIERMEG